MAGTCIFYIVISKLSNWQEPCPIIVFKVDKSLEIRFHYVIFSFYLAIYLWIKGSKKFRFDNKEVAEQ